MSHDIEDHASPNPIGATVPMAQPIPDPEGPFALPPGSAPPPMPWPQSLPRPEFPFPDPFHVPWPPFHFCKIDLPEGCYRISFAPNNILGTYQGTMRVDKAGGKTTVSGDLYWVPPYILALGSIGRARPASLIEKIPFPRPLGIPIYPRANYHSYLKVTGMSQSPLITTGLCTLTLTVDEYEYTLPPAGSFNGSFPSAPSRTLSIVFSPQSPPWSYPGAYFTGNAYQGTTQLGGVSMGWVSPYFRRATLEIDSLTGAVSPQTVGTENFKSVFATAGWSLSVIYDQTNVHVPAGVTAADCWSAANLHALMLSVRKPTTDLDKEWRMHLVVVPAKLGCGRGVMYDTINVPREGVASFCDDGYPSGDSSNFGTAANQKQRDIPRAFIRSANHEVGHGFNQVHQENEGGADNSIMTTTPSVADILGGPATGAPGVFPDDIALRFNNHVRHHLVHFPDIVVRPGGMTFGTGHSGTSIPEVDKGRHYFPSTELELTLTLKKQRVKLGEPLTISWCLENKTKVNVRVPSDIMLAAQHAFISVTDPHGHLRQMRSYVIQTDKVKIKDLKPGEKLEAETDLFWSTQGFAFTTPGHHVVEMRVLWSYEGVPVGSRASVNVFVDYPISDADNEVAAQLMNDEVGKFIALGGARHLKEAVARIEKVVGSHADHPACEKMCEFSGHKHYKAKKK